MENSWKKKEKQKVLMKSSQNQIQIQNQQLRKLSKTPYPPAQVEEEEEEVKVAAVGISLNIRLRSADMPQSMQQHAFRYTASLLHDHSSCPTPTLLARALKKEFDSSYGLLWHCIAGKSFGSFVTHSKGGFLYFSLDSHNLSFLLFKTEVQLVT